MAERSDAARPANSVSPKVIVVRDSVDVGAVTAVEVGDVELVVWRTADGELRANDARCPHQWSHFAAEGTVDGDALVCTSHFWRFGADGAGCTIDAQGVSQAVSGVVTYPVDERADGTIEITLTPNAPPVWR